MAAEIIKSTGEETGEFVKAFALVYVSELINSKINGAIEDAIAEVMPSAIGGGDDEEEAGGNEEKALEDKEDAEAPIAAGCIMAGYKNAWGPDKIYHKYYDFATYAIRAENSVIAKKTYLHTTLLNFYKKLKRATPLAKEPFPGKKRFGKKTAEFYRGRFTGMQGYFNSMSQKDEVTGTDEFLVFFGLKYDAAAAERRELFLTALEAQCDKDNINYQAAYRRAQRIGLDESEVEMLKFVAIEKVGASAASKLRVEVAGKVGFLPASFQNRAVNKACNNLYGAIGTTVETGWNAAEDGFKKVADGLSEAMDKATEPIKEMFTKVMTPVKELIDSKIQKPESKEDPLDEALQGIGPDRFPPVTAAIAALKGSGKAVDACKDLMASIGDLNYTHKYTPYIQYNCGDPDILEWFPPIENIADKHQRLTVALIDVTYVLGRGMCRAFMPLCEYADRAAENFDEKSHEDEIKKAVNIGGSKLAIDYFDLPSSTWRATWWCGNRITKSVMTFCRETVNLQADVLGSVATNWKPTSNDDVKTTFADALESALTKFLNDRVWTIVTLIRDSAAKMIGNLVLSVVGDAIEKIAEVLNDLVSKLPPPLADLKPGDIVSNLLVGMVEKIAMFAVLKWARKPEMFLSGQGEPEPWDEALAKKFRVTPRIRNDDDDLAAGEPDEEEETADGGDAGGDGGGDEKKEE